MQITSRTTYNCEDEEEYKKALEMIKADKEDLEDFNDMCNGKDTLEIESEDKVNLIITTVANYY